MAQTRAIFGGGDFARDAGVIERGHVDEEASRQRDVTGDARALFAERLFGDLDDDLLALLEEIGNQLRAARLLAMPAVPLMRAASTATIIAARTVAGTVAAAAITTIASAVSAAAGAAACGGLHARAEISANAGAPFLRLAADGFAFERNDDIGGFRRGAGLGCLRACGLVRRIGFCFGRSFDAFARRFVFCGFRLGLGFQSRRREAISGGIVAFVGLIFGLFLGVGILFGRGRSSDFRGGIVFVAGFFGRFLAGFALFAFGFFELRFGDVLGQSRGFLFGQIGRNLGDDFLDAHFFDRGRGGCFDGVGRVTIELVVMMDCFDRFDWLDCRARFTRCGLRNCGFGAAQSFAGQRFKRAA